MTVKTRSSHHRTNPNRVEDWSAVSRNVKQHAAHHDEQIHSHASPSREMQTLSVPFLPSTVPESENCTTNEIQSSPPLEPIPHNVILPNIKMNSQGEATNGTQEISQSIYESIIKRTKSTSIPEVDCEVDDIPEHVQTNQSRRVQDGSTETQHTYHEGDEGHIDLTSSFITPRDEDTDLPDAGDVDLSPSQPQTRFSRFPESQRFKTPATSGKKRYHNGDTVETSRVPQNPLRQGEPTPSRMMGLSQVFAGTQAASSPLSNGHPTVLRSDRPSPNIELQTRPTSIPTSSPLRPISDLRRAVTEPAVRYVPMKLSQAERDHHVEADSQGVGATEEYDDFETQSSTTRRRRREKEREQRIRNQLRAITRSESPIMSRADNRYSPGVSERQMFDTSQHSETHGEHQSTDGEPLYPVILPDEHENRARTLESEEETEQEDAESTKSKQAKVVPVVTSEDKENHHVIVQRTVARPQRMMDTHQSHMEASPCIRYSSKMPAQLEQRSSSGDAFRIANSQPSQNSPKRLSLSQPMNKSRNDGVEIIEQSQPLSRIRGQQRTSGDEKEENLEPGEGPSTDPNNADYNLAEPPTYEGTAPSTVLETSSGVRNGVLSTGNNLDLTDQERNVGTETCFDTADTHLSTNLGILRSSQASSQPIKVTPPGRRRKRMTELSAHPTPVKSTPSFDAGEALQLDPDQELATYLKQSPRRRITYKSKHQHTETSPSHVRLASSALTECLSVPAPALEHSLSASTGATEELSPPDLSQDVIQPVRQKRQTVLAKLPRNALPASSTRKSVWDIELSPPKPLVNDNRIVTKIPDVVQRSQANRETPMTKSQTFSNIHQDNCVSSTLKDHALPIDLAPPAGDIIASKMVFACFNGKVRAYYPAICLGLAGSDTKRYQVQWDGYDPDEVDAYGVRALDIRIGDAVKINIDGFPKIPYVIHGFTNRIENASDVITDIRGYRTLIVAPKQRKSLPADIKIEQVKEVPVAAIYLDNNMWNQLKTRTFDFMPTTKASLMDCATPSVRAGTPVTPSSRNRRQIGDQETSASVPMASGMFTNMVFAISYEGSDRKHALVDMVRSEGGSILNGSFNDLLENDDIQLKSRYQDSGFTALLTDRHSRKEKYMQALALGLPCLNGSWVDACIKAASLLDWQTYLLPAGESAELEGATRSRTLPPMDLSTIKLTSIISTRPNLFMNAPVVVVVGRGKAEAKRSPYVLLIQALGAGKVSRVVDAQAAKDLIDADPEYQWVFVEDKDVHATQNLLRPGRGQSKHGKLSNRKDGQQNKRECMVAGNELIVQSLILQKLCKT